MLHDCEIPASLFETPNPDLTHPTMNLKTPRASNCTALFDAPACCNLRHPRAAKSS